MIKAAGMSTRNTNAGDPFEDTESADESDDNDDSSDDYADEATGRTICCRQGTLEEPRTSFRAGGTRGPPSSLI